MDVSSVIVGTGAAPAITALISIILKPIPRFDNDRWSPLASLILGIAWNVGAVGVGLSDYSYGVAVFVGIMTGLAASGLYSGGKSVAGIKQSEPLVINPPAEPKP